MVVQLQLPFVPIRLSNTQIGLSLFVFAESSISADSDCQSHVWRRLRVEEESGRGPDGRASRQRPTGNRQQRKRRHFRNATSPSATVSGENHGKPQINYNTRKLILNAEVRKDTDRTKKLGFKDYYKNTPIK